ncbi:hypothetical protein MTO96_049697 [Rhipicephalus appendiculatus]
MRGPGAARQPGRRCDDPISPRQQTVQGVGRHKPPRECVMRARHVSARFECAFRPGSLSLSFAFAGIELRREIAISHGGGVNEKKARSLIHDVSINLSKKRAQRVPPRPRG